MCMNLFYTERQGENLKTNIPGFGSMGNNQRRVFEDEARIPRVITNDESTAEGYAFPRLLTEFIGASK